MMGLVGGPLLVGGLGPGPPGPPLKSGTDYNISVIFCLLHYSFLSVMKKNVWHSIEQCTIDVSVDQWHSQLKTHTCDKGEHLKHMMEINLHRKTKK